jgi:hypothetical protein
LLATPGSGAAAVVPSVDGYAPRLAATAVFVAANGAGHAVAYALARAGGAPLRRVLAALLALEAAALCAAWAAGAAGGEGDFAGRGAPRVLPVACLYSLAMGLQNAAVLEALEKFSQPDLGRACRAACFHRSDRVKDGRGQGRRRPSRAPISADKGELLAGDRDLGPRDLETPQWPTRDGDQGGQHAARTHGQRIAQGAMAANL